MWPTILVATVIGVIFLAILIKGIVDKKKGKHTCSCGGSCGACPMGASCHAATPEKK